MKFLWLLHELDPSAGGIQRYCHAQLSHFAALGHGNFVYRMQPGPPLDPALATEMARWPKVDRVARVRRLRRLIRKAGIDRILCTHLHLAGIAAPVAEAADCPFDLFVYGIEAWGDGFRRQTAHYRKLDRVVSISRFTTEQLMLQGCQADRIVHVPPTIDPARRRAARPAPSPSAPDHHDPLRLLTVGRLDAAERYKGQDRVIEALPAIASEVPNVSYRIVGKGADRSRLATLAKQYGVTRRVEFAGFVPDESLADEYAAADLFLMPSRTTIEPNKTEGEGFGIVFLEAARHGLPLIGPKTGGASDIVIDGVTGIAVNPDDPEQIAHAVCSMAADPALRQRLGDQARQVARERFGPKRLLEAWKPYFEAVEAPTPGGMEHGGREQDGAEHRWKQHGWQHADNPFKIELLERFAHGHVAIDLGAGRGAYGSFLCGQGFRVTAIDEDNRLVDERIAYVDHDLEGPLPIADASVDVVMAWDIIEHVAAEPQLWKEIDRVLRPGGRVFISVPNADDSRIAASHLTYVHHKDKTHVRAYTPADLHRWANLLQWRVEHLEAWGGHGYPYLLLHYIDRPSVRLLAKAFIKTLDTLGQLERGDCHGDLYAVFQKPS